MGHKQKIRCRRREAGSLTTAVGQQRKEMTELYLSRYRRRDNLGLAAQLGFWEGAALRTGLTLQRQRFGIV